METNSMRISSQSRRYAKVQNLMHNVNEQNLMAQHRHQKLHKAPGIDKVDKQRYETHVNENIGKLVQEMKKLQYRPLPVRRAYIDKGNGKMRPLGIPAYEDRLVQRAMADILNQVYEPRFLDCSMGFHPNRSAHDTVAYINQVIMCRKVNYVLEADIRGFFDNVNHDWMMKFLANDIDDKNFLRYVKRFLIAGIMEGTEYHESDKGTPQGGQISPILANVYLHYVLDLWVTAVKKHIRGQIYYVRYADDLIIMFQYWDDAQKVMTALKPRLAKFSLELAEEKTRIFKFGRFAENKEEFDFLGFTFFNTHTAKGKYRVGIRTSKKKLKAKRQKAKEWLKTRLNKNVTETMKLIRVSLLGHYNYYGVNGNYTQMRKFYEYLKYVTHKMLNRRSERAYMRWGKFNKIWDYHIPKPKITKNIWNWSVKIV